MLVPFNHIASKSTANWRSSANVLAPIQREDFKLTLDYDQKWIGLSRDQLIFKIGQNIVTISMDSTPNFLYSLDVSAT